MLRNLRDFDQAGISDQVAETVAAKLSDPGEVAKSRVLPMRFLSAYNAALSLRWACPLKKALQRALWGAVEVAQRASMVTNPHKQPHEK